MPSIEHDIQKAIEGGEFVPYFQPIVELRSGSIEGFEILARWFHPLLGPIAPNEFIPIIEKYNLTNALSSCLLKRAFAAGSLLPATIGLSVNVAPCQLHDRTLPALIGKLADKSGFDLRRLTVELTESALVDDLELAGRVADDLKGLGMRLALDDFGTGYSSLLHLHALPFDELKIDGSFVRSMAACRQSRKITAAVVSLGESLGLRTVAEGIEQRDEAQLLVWQGCNQGQGWLYGHPVPADRLPDIAEQRVLGASSVGVLSREVTEMALGLHAHPSDRRSQLEAIYDGAPVGLCFLDRELRYVNLNRRLAEMNGLPIEAHLGRKVADVLPDRFPQAEPFLLRALAGEAFSDGEVPWITLDGAKGAVLISYQPARDERGEVVGVSVCLVDVSSFPQDEMTLPHRASTLLLH